MDPNPGPPRTSGMSHSSISQHAAGMDWSARPSSAPPALELTSQNLFTFQMKGLFDDVVLTTPPIQEQEEEVGSLRSASMMSNEAMFEIFRPRRQSRGGESDTDWRQQRVSRCSDADLLAEVMNAATLGYPNDIEETGDTPRTPKWIGMNTPPTHDGMMGGSNAHHYAAMQAAGINMGHRGSHPPGQYHRMDRGLPGDLHMNVQQRLQQQLQHHQLQQQQQAMLQQYAAGLLPGGGLGAGLHGQGLGQGMGHGQGIGQGIGQGQGIGHGHPHGHPHGHDFDVQHNGFPPQRTSLLGNSVIFTGGGGGVGGGVGGGLQQSSRPLDQSDFIPTAQNLANMQTLVQNMQQQLANLAGAHELQAGFAAMNGGIGPSGGGQQTTPVKNKPQAKCRYYLQGLCNKGDSCKFSHAKDGGPPTSASPPPQAKTKPARASPVPTRNQPTPINVVVPLKELVPLPVVDSPEDISKMVDEIKEAVDIKGKVWSLARDQNGCRRLQSLLEEASDPTDTLDMILEESLPNFGQLMIDPFGNYLVQKMFEYCNDSQKARIVYNTASCLVQAAFNIHGTRAVQKLIDVAGSELEQVHCIESAFSSHVVELIKDLNGNHVIQRCLQRFPNDCKGFIFNAISGNCVELATHRHGCCVLQRCLDNASPIQRSTLVTEILGNALTLVMDPYGNYVIQYVLEQSTPDTSQLVVASLLGSLHKLATQKFSSNVVEKCIERANEKMRSCIVRELADSERIEHLLHDPFGNYVVQRALSSAAPGEDLLKLVEAIRPHSASLSTSPFGKRILTKLKKRVGNFPWENDPKDGMGSPNSKDGGDGGGRNLPGGDRGDRSDRSDRGDRGDRGGGRNGNSGGGGGGNGGGNGGGGGGGNGGGVGGNGGGNGGGGGGSGSGGGGGGGGGNAPRRRGHRGGKKHTQSGTNSGAASPATGMSPCPSPTPGSGGNGGGGGERDFE